MLISMKHDASAKLFPIFIFISFAVTVGSEADRENFEREKLSTRETMHGVLHDGSGVEGKPSPALIKSVLELICDESVSNSP